MIVIVPNTLRDAIHAAIDKALGGRPCSEDDRKALYQQMLNIFNEHGVIPEFRLDKNEEESP